VVKIVLFLLVIWRNRNEEQAVAGTALFVMDDKQNEGYWRGRLQGKDGVNLDGQDIGDAGAEALAAALKENTTLRAL